jgi:hypothetical protein
VWIRQRRLPPLHVFSLRWRWWHRVDPAVAVAAAGGSGGVGGSQGQIRSPFFTVSHFFYRITSNRIQFFSSEFFLFLESEIFFFSHYFSRTDDGNTSIFLSSRDTNVFSTFLQETDFF